MKLKLDYQLLITSLLLIFLGIIFLSGASALPSQIKTGRPDYFITRHIFFVFIGLIIGFIAYKSKMGTLKKIAPYLFLANIFLLLLVFLPWIGIRLGGANRWINLYFFSLQPSEFLKITLVLYLSSWFSSKNILSKKEKGNIIVPFIAILSVIGLIFISQPDMSTLAIIFSIALSIYFFSSYGFLKFLLVFIIILVFFSSIILISGYRVDRIMVFLGIADDPLGMEYQLRQSIISIGSGGVRGEGLGTYNQSFSLLPQAIGDSIFPVIARETGFIGSLVIILLFFFFFYRVMKIAEKTRDDFSALVAIGIGIWIYLQSVVNISSMAGIIPVTGIPLPFISYGGSHIISELIALGILLNISKSS